MSREIKFRAWDNLNKKMLFSKPGLWNDTNPRHTIASIKVPEVVNKFGRYFDYEVLSDFMQYTGLKDKNGAEIYEGDILRLYDQTTYEVMYNDNTAQFDLSGNYHEYNLAEYISSWDGEIVGNRYENPELLESK